MSQAPTPNPEATPPAQESDIPKDARTWAMLAHLTHGFIHFWGPLLVWLIKGKEHPFIDKQAKEALNWTITLAIGMVICIPLFFICIGIPLLIALQVCNIVFAILGAIKTNNGIAYRYPFAFRFIK